MAFFGVNYILQKFCPCKKNDKYQVCLPYSKICRHTCHSICSVSGVCCSECNVNIFWGGDTSISVGIFCIVGTFSPKGKCVHFRCYGTVWQFCHNVMHHRMLWSVNNSRKRRTQLPCIQKEIRARSFHCFAKCHHQILNKFTVLCLVLIEPKSMSLCLFGHLMAEKDFLRTFFYSKIEWW